MNRASIGIFVACALLALLTLAAHAADAASLPQLQVAQLADTTPAPLPATIIDGSQDNAFQLLTTPSMAASSSNDRWYRLELGVDWTATELPVLSLQNTRNARVWIYAPPSFQPHLLQSMRTDTHSPFARHTLADVLPRGIRAGQPIYLRVEKSKRHPQMTLALTDLASYQTADLNQVRLATAFESIQAAMLLIGLFLWLLLRDRVFIYFSGYIGTQLIYMMLINGEIYELPGGSVFLSLGNNVAWPFALLTVVLAISFIIAFCNLRQSVPRTAAALGWLRWPALLLTPLCLLSSGPFWRILWTAGNLLILAACVMAMGAVSLALCKGNRQARYFAVAWMPQLAFTIFRTLQIMAGWHEPAWINLGFPFSMTFATLVITLGLADQTLHARRERDIADNLAHHDPLTGAFNRRAVQSRLDTAVAAAHHSGRPLMLLFLDVDHFKSINDVHGHAVGDHCLQTLVEMIGHELRAGGWMGRYGGEEFVIVLPDTNHENARAIGERVRARVEAHPLQLKGKTVRMTVSLGAAGLVDSRDSADALLERADAALYRAKSDGRNRLSFHPSLATVAGS